MHGWKRAARASALVVAAVALLAGCGPITDTTNAHNHNRGTWVNFPLSTISPAGATGHIGVEFTFYGDNASQQYNPCHNAGDTYFEVCATANSGAPSYFDVVPYDSTRGSIANGIFVGNSDVCENHTGQLCDPGEVINHGFADRVDHFHIEVYATNDPRIGDTRMEAECCGMQANGGYYAFGGDVGTLTLPQCFANNTCATNAAYLNGTITGTAPLPQVSIAMFGWDNDATSLTGNGMVAQGFGANDSTTGDDDNNDLNKTDANDASFYRTKPVYSGLYKIVYEVPGVKKVVAYRHVVNAGDVVNLNLNQPCFGLVTQGSNTVWETSGPDLDHVDRAC